MEWGAFFPCQGVTATVNTTFLKVDEFIKLQRLHVQFSIWRRRDVYDWSSAHHVNLFHIISKFLCPIYSGWIKVIHQPASSWNKAMCGCFRESEPSKQNIIPSLPHDVMINFIQIGVYYGLLSWYTISIPSTSINHSWKLSRMHPRSGYGSVSRSRSTMGNRSIADLERRWDGEFLRWFFHTSTCERERERYIYICIYIIIYKYK